MKDGVANGERRRFFKQAAASVAAIPLLPLSARAGACKETSLQVWSCGGLAEAFMPANKEYEKRTGTTIAYTGAFAAALGKSLLGSAQTEVFAPRVLDLARKLKEAGKMVYFKPLCFTQYVVVTPKGNPAGITSITDLGRPGVRVVLAPQASPPGGEAVKVILKKAGIEEAALTNTVIQGSCVQTIMDDVIDGKGDASVVEMRLTRIARFAGQVEVIPIPPEFLPPPPLTFTIGVMKYAKDRDLTDHYVNFIRSEAGQQFFEQAGFIPAISEQGKRLVEKLGVHDV